MVTLLVLGSLAPSPVLAWSGHQVTQGDLRLLIEEVPVVTERDTPVPVRVTLTNGGAAPVSGTLEVREMVDDSRVVGESRKPFTVAAGGAATADFTVAFGAGTYSALYPVHVYAALPQGEPLHAVRIVKTQFAVEDVTSDAPTPMEALTVPRQGALALWTTGKQRVAWGYYDQPLKYKASGWRGSDSQSRASFDLTTVARGESRAAIQMHPPWVPGGGPIHADYLVKLPDTRPLTLTFANAIRDNTEKEPPSDGVLFRVWAGEGTEGANARLLCETFIAAKQWVPGEADLSEFAGRTILLRLESHPGPKRDTTCDSSYWAEPRIIAGEPQAAPQRPSLEAAAAAGERLGRRLLAGETGPDSKVTFLLGQGDRRLAAVLQPTSRGIIDGSLTLVGPNSAVTFDGLAVDVLQQPVLRGSSGVAWQGYEVRTEGGRAAHVHRLELDGRPFELAVSVWAEGDGLRVALTAPERITDLALGAADRKAPAVYYGHGYRIVNPGAFRAGFGGHNLSTSHVGCDFEGGMSVLQATDVPPDYFEVTPDANRYALHAHLSGMITLVPSEAGAFDCALRYRPLYDKQPAPGVTKLAGRYCFDIWGGRYATVADRMAEMLRYGLTDAFLTMHVWQRWGYDYRLPDIWPPDPGMGTVEDLRRLGEVCAAAGLPWGLHDNYIDFYPDAADYSYDHICFTQDGRPIPAWLNEGREAQSYRWRPDHIQPFVERNLKLIKASCAPTHYFIDVFTSIGCIDFYDRDGNFHSSLESRQKWGEAFAWIREYLGDNAPTTSEAGHDQLIGYLDGADCQHLTLSDKPTDFTIYTPCDEWERVPWFDAVNHSRFIQHGVGYSNRYEGGGGRVEHGINSDDYLSAEVLEGHALMTDAGSWGRPMVRKYWLAQDIARRLALQEITGVDFADGDMHRQTVTWSDGTRVYVNRGETDWSLDGRVLPQYGYLVQGDGLTSAIEKRDGVFCESTVGPGGWYCDARTVDPDRRVRIAPRIEGFQPLGDRRFRWEVVWQADEPAPRDLTVFVHFYGRQATRADKIAFQDDHRPQPPTSQWRGEVRYAREITVPEQAAGEYEVGFGQYDADGRLSILGPPTTDGGAIRMGVLTVQRSAEGVRSIAFEPAVAEPMPPSRTNVDRRPVDFDFAVTDGAFRVQQIEGGLRLTPLPESPSFSVSLRLAAFGLGGRTVRSLTAFAPDGARHEAALQQQGDTLILRHDGVAFAYEVGF